MFGGGGRDRLFGDSGNDYLVGGEGKDELDGGKGDDTFFIQVGTEVDRIKKLEAGDRIDLSEFGFTSADEVIAAFQQDGKHAVLDLGEGDRLILERTKIENLSAAQFIVSDEPSSSQAPYLEGVDAAITTRALLTAGDTAGIKSDGVTPWTMVGAPDGLGAFDNGDGTFTVLMNHELDSAEGVARDHGATGAFVSRLVIDKETLTVVDGSDLVQSVHLYDTGTDRYYNPLTDGDAATLPYAFDRLCSADLAKITAFYNPETGLGYKGRIFLNGEEAGAEGKAFAHFVSGSLAGKSYELPWLGNMAFENVVANPHTGNRTVVAAMDDSSGGQVYFYFGDKKATGNALQKAGFTGGTLFGLKVDEFELTGSEPDGPDPLGEDGTSGVSFVSFGNVSEISGAELQTESEATGISGFLRPEDGAWDTVRENRFYFVTTNTFDAPSRLWAVDFENPSEPEAGGTIRLLLDGSEGQQMLDNLAVTADGKLILQEDPGDNEHLAKVWEYDPESDELTLLAQHDPDHFLSGGSDFLTENEGSSGVIDVTDILGSDGRKAFLLDVQAQYGIPGETVRGGQLLMMYQDVDVI
jgi:hypothetical protein